VEKDVPIQANEVQKERTSQKVAQDAPEGMVWLYAGYK